tara:strand:+ start:416 stop:706 length:291 start_codon:yes stop_codon:yes gene_type:complete
MVKKIILILDKMAKLLVNDLTLKSTSPLNFLERFYLNLLMEQLEWYIINRPREFLESVEYRYKNKLTPESSAVLQYLLMSPKIEAEDSYKFYKLYL